MNFGFENKEIRNILIEYENGKYYCYCDFKSDLKYKNVLKSKYSYIIRTSGKTPYEALTKVADKMKISK